MTPFSTNCQILNLFVLRVGEFFGPMELKILKFQSFQEPIIVVPIIIPKTPDNTATLKKALSAREENASSAEVKSGWM